MRIRCVVPLLLLVAGCKGKGASAPLPTFPDGPAGLAGFGQAVLDAAKRDERQRVHDLLASTILTDAELDALLGAERAARHRAKYRVMMETLANRGALELVAQIYERKYDAVEVVPDADPALARVLGPSAPRIYAVRFKKKDEDRGLRYDFFMYINKRWATGNLIGKDLL